MNIFSRTYLRLILICATFTILFGIICSIMLTYILNSNMKLVCDVYYQQISSKLEDDILLLQSANEYLAESQLVVDYLNTLDKDPEIATLAKEAVLREIYEIEKILDAISFVKSINIVDLEDKYIFSKGYEVLDFDITKRPWYDDSYFNYSSQVSKITSKHEDYTTGKSTISIASLIYSTDFKPDEENKPIGASVLNIYIDDLLDYIDKNFYAGVLETQIYEKDFDLQALIESFDKSYNYSVYSNTDILDNGDYLVFKFDKSSLANGYFTKNILRNMQYFLWLISLILSILLFISIRLSFKAALMSIDKLKSILSKLSNDSFSVDDKNEFRQLEILADTLNKSFDDRIQELIYYDELTGLPNRKMLEHICLELIKKDEPFALIFIDLNKFKYINDVFGHSVGDEYLIKFSSIMRDVLKGKGTFTRYSGDEFILVYNDYLSKQELLEFYTNNIVKTFASPIKINSELTIEIGFSAGVASYPNDAKDFDQLIHKSDFMMYINKKNFVNKKISFFNEAMYDQILYIEKIKTLLKTALNNNEFYLNYQPIVDMNKNIVKAEALIRWNNPELGIIRPDHFIKYLEETRQIIPVGYWIIEDVCKNIKEFNTGKNSVQISINISALQLMLKDFVSNVKSIVEKYEINYEDLCFEITETVLLERKTFVANNIKELRDLGIKIALDDFGTGYSSFNYLRSYNLDILKIDKSFLNDNTQLDYDIINKIKGIAHLLDIRVLIEGVETEEQFNSIKEIGIDYIQGYYFSKPLPLEEFKKAIGS